MKTEGGIPIGSVLVHSGTIVSRGHNRRIQKGCAILHGEMDALESAGRRPAAFYRECTLYTTLSPCSMCSGAILLYGIPRVVIGENQSFMGEERWLSDHGVQLQVVQDPRCIQLWVNLYRTIQPCGPRISVSEQCARREWGDEWIVTTELHVVVIT